MKKQIYWFSVILGAMIFVSGSNSATAAVQTVYTPSPSAKIVMGKMSNTSGQKFDVNVEQMLTDALQEQLFKEQLLFIQGENTKITLNCNITKYAEGSAVKRALVPGWGGTVLETQCEMIESNNVVGSITASKSVKVRPFGGGGAWKAVFNDVSEIIAKDVKSKIPSGNNAQGAIKNTSSNAPVNAQVNAPVDTSNGQTGSKEKDDIARLDKLKSMKDRGIITQQEYDQKRKAIIDSM